MAPSMRGKRGGYGISARSTVGGSRGGAYGLKVRKGKSGRGSQVATKKDVFYPTRVEEQLPEFDSESAEEVRTQEDEDHLVDVSDVSNDSGDDGPPERNYKAYSSLLDSLGATKGLDGPKRKRQKTDSGQTQYFSADTAPSEKVGLEDDVDEVLEPELSGESEMEGDDDLDEADEDKDPFTKHFFDWDENALARSIEGLKTWSNAASKPFIQKEWVTTYQNGSNEPNMPVLGSSTALRGIDHFYLKERLKGLGEQWLPPIDDIFASLASAVFNYKDVLFPQRTLENANKLREMGCLHALNHLFKTRDKIIKNNARLSQNSEAEDLEFRDQGFTRPKVLIILPSRHSCNKYVETIVSLCKPEQQENKKRFSDTYANGMAQVSDSKPLDFQELFAGNDDDLFRLGMKFTRKTIKFFSQFYNSDIIFASPLGLRMALGADDPKKQDHDFLSSIEIVIVDQADAIAMQNWEHMDYIFEHLNLQPKETHRCDFSRVRHWYLDGRAKYLRQTILLSAFNFPTLNKVYKKSIFNVAGKMKYDKKVEGAMVDIGLSFKQTFFRFEYKSPVSEPDDRFNYFSTTVVPSLAKHAKVRPGSNQGTLLFISSYADFVRVRNYLASSSDTQDISFGSISEYTSVSEVARARSHFLSGRHTVLLYTERAHHFRRYRLKGVKKIVMYALPENPIFYKEIVGDFLQSTIVSGQTTARDTGVRALFSKLDMMKLERIVGSSRVLSMLKAKSGDTFEFE